MKNQVGSSRLDTVLKMLAIAFISLLAFSSGVFFGKQMSDSDYQLKALEGDFNKAEKVAAHSKAGASEQSEEGLVDEEVASLTDKYVNAEKAKEDTAAHEDRKIASEEAADEHAAQPAAHGREAAAPAKAAPAKEHAAAEETHAPAKAAPAPVAHAPAPAAKPAKEAQAAKPDLSAAHVAANRVASNHAPTEPVKPQAEPTIRVPSSLPKTIGTSSDIEFTVQVASYPTAEAAKEHASELVKKGFPAFPVEASVGGRTWYRVSVGSFKSMKEASVYRAQLLKQADLPSAIVQRIQR